MKPEATQIALEIGKRAAGLDAPRDGSLTQNERVERLLRCFSQFPQKETLTRFERHSKRLVTRSDRRALWMTCVGVAACEIDPPRRLEAIRRAKEWMEEQPSRAPLFRRWLDLLETQETLETVLGADSRQSAIEISVPTGGKHPPKGT